MRLLLDECVDRRLATLISGHDVDSVQDVGWRSLQNGELIRLAEARYDVFVTVDRNLAFQQPIGRFKLAVIILRAKSNDVDDLRPLVPKLLAVLPTANPGTVTWVESPARK